MGETNLENTEVTNAPVEDVQQEVVQDNVEVAPSAEENVERERQLTQAENFKRLRESKDRVERERDELHRRIRDLEMSNNNSKQSSEEEEDLTITIAPDDLAEGKHLNKVSKKIKRLEKQLENYQKQASTESVEAKLKYEYPDFDKIVSKDNIESLKIAYPEIARTLNDSTDLYSKAISAYTMIKKLGIHVEDTFGSDKTRVSENASKPRPLTSVSPQQGGSPLSKANAFAGGLTPELKKQLYREMLEATK